VTAIIRVLWGSDVPEGRWIKVRRDVQAMLRHQFTCPQHVYVYGRSNADMFNNVANCHTVLVNDNPFPDGQTDHRHQRTLRRPWHYKFQLLRQAVLDHGSVIYCDWDVICCVTDVAKAFATLEHREHSFSAYMYRRLRFPERTDHRAQRFVPVGNWLYFRGTAFIDRVLSWMSRDEPWAWHDELTIGRIIDSDHDGWPGDIVWLQDYESPIMCQRNGRSPWPLLTRDGNMVTRHTPIPFTWTKMFAQYDR